MCFNDKTFVKKKCKQKLIFFMPRFCCKMFLLPQIKETGKDSKHIPLGSGLLHPPPPPPTKKGKRYSSPIKNSR